MGEDIDDFVVRTKSKTDQIIRDYTAVASNAYKGVSVLDDNGNLRDTYDILLDIAEVYEEIQKEDKKMGTNRAQALVETLAGKNRSNIAASILQNAKTLKQVREASLNDFAGSADQENEKYLDSINGKVAQFQNRMQELASVTIDSGWIKDIVSFGTKAVEILTALGKKYNLISAAVVTFSAGVLQKKGYGLLNFDKDGNFAGTILDKLRDDFKAKEKTIWGDDLLESIFEGADMSANFNEFWSKKKDEVNVDELSESIHDAFETAGEDDTINDMLDRVGEKVKETGNGFRNLGKIALTAISSIGTALVANLLALGVEKFISWAIDNTIRANQIIKEQARDAKESIKDITNSFENKKSFLNDKNLDKYEQLRKGVLISDNDGVKNISLTNEEYSEFLSLNSQIADMFPTLVTGFDDQGTAILNLSTNASEATQTLNGLLEQEQLLANFKIGEELTKVIKGFRLDYEELNTSIEGEEATIKFVEQMQDRLADESGKIDINKLGINLDERTFGFNYNPDDHDTEDFLLKLRDLFNQSANDILGPEWELSFNQNLGNEVEGILKQQFTGSEEQFNEIIDEYIIKVMETFDFDKLTEKGIDAMRSKEANENKLAAKWNELLPSLLGQIELYPEFNNLSNYDLGEKFQQMIKNQISNMYEDLDSFTDEEWEAFEGNDEEKTREFLNKRFMKPILDVISDKNGNISQSIMKEVSDTINNVDVNSAEYYDNINDLANKLIPGDDDEAIMKRINFKVALGVTYYDEETKKEYRADEIKLNQLMDLTGLSRKKLNSLKREDLNLAYDLMDTSSFSYQKEKRGGEIRPFEDFIKWLDTKKKARDKAEEIVADNNFSSTLLDEGYQKDAEGYEKALSSLTSAMETLRSEGTLTAEAMRDLQEQFPTLTDFSFESISNEAEKQLGGWINRISEDWKDMSPEGIKQMQTYITNLAASYGELDISSQEAMKAVYSNFIDENASENIQERQGQKAEEAINQLKEVYGENINWQIVWTLAMEDRFSDPAANIQQEYDQHLIVWKLTIDTQKALAEIEKAKQVAESEESYQESRRQNKEAHGETLTSSDYTGSVNIATTKKNLAQQRVDIINDEISKLLDDPVRNSQQLQQAYSDYMAAMTELNNADTELANVQKQKIEAGANILKDQEANLETQITAQELKISEAEANKVDPSIIDGYRNELKTLQKSLSSVQYQLYSKYLNDFAANNSEYAEEFTKTAYEYLSKSQSSSEAAEATQKAINDGKWARNEAVLNNLNTRTSDAENLMKQREEQGYKVEASYYEGAIKAATEERKELVRQQQEAQDELDKIRKDRENKGWDEDKIQADDDYQEAETRVNSFRSRFLELAQSITGWRKQLKSGIRLDELSTEFEQLEDKAEHFQKVINDEKRPANAADYVGAYLNAENEVANLQEQIVLKQQELSKVDFGTPKYNQIKDEVDSLKDSLDAVKDAQDGFVKSLFDMPINNVNSTIDQYKANLQALQDEQALNAKKGIRRTAEDIQKEINENQNILTAQKGLGLLYKAKDWGLGLLGYDKNSEERKQLAKEMQDNQSGITSLIGSIFDLNKEKMDLPITNLQKDIDSTTKSAERLKTAFDEISNSGREITEADYKPLQDNIDKQIAQYEHLAELNADRMDDADVMGTDLEMDYLNAQIDAEQQIASLKQQQHEYDLAIENIPVTKLQNQLDNMQQKEQEINDLISNKQAKGLKVNEREYKTLADLSRAQIKNLQDQNKEYDSQLKRASELKLSWQEQKDIRDKIAANKSTISGLEVDAIGFDEQAKTLLVTQAKELASNISTALSEVTSETGLAQETIDALTTGFSDLSGVADISSVFYNTTDGVKVNVVALEELAKKQNEIVNAQFAQKMADAQAKLADAAKGTEAYKQATEEIRELMEQQAQYFAQYEEQMKKFNEHGMIELADATANPGTNYDKAANYLKEAKDMYDKGLVGTDDFKARAAYFDAYGFEDWETFKANYDKFKDYFNKEDAFKGVQKFVSDLKDKGLVTVEKMADGSETTKGNFEDIAEAARTMGMSETFFKDMFGKAEDFGAVAIIIDSEQEAILKTEELSVKLENAQQKYLDMIKSGADTSALDKQREVINDIKDQMDSVKEAEQSFIEGTKQDFIDEFTNLPQTVDNIRKAFTNGDISYDQAVNEIQELADKHHIKLSFEAGQFPTIDESSYSAQAEKLGVNYMDRVMNAAQERYETAKQKYQNDLAEATMSGVDLNRTVYGNIDTNNRQAITWDISTLESNKAALQSWYSEAITDWSGFVQDWQGTISTVIGSADEYGGYEIAFSPILQTDHGAELLSKGTVDKYMDAIFTDLSSREGGWSTEDLFKLDAEGIMIDGQLIKGLIADIGETAQQTSQQMHFTGELGALNLDFSELQNSEQAVQMFEKIKEASTDANSGVEDLINKLSEVDTDDLDIVFGDKKLSEQYGEIETALDGLLSQFGLGQESGELLLEVFKEIVEKKRESEQNAGDIIEASQAQKAQQALDVVKELAETEDIEIDFSIEDKNKSIETLNDEIEELKKKRDSIDPASGQSDIDALNSVIQDKEATIKIKTELEESGDARARLEELKEMDDKTLATEFDVNVDSEEFQKIKQQIDEMKESDVSITVAIAEDQFNQLKKDNADAGTATIKILANNKEANGAVENTKAYAEGANPVMKIYGDGQPARDEAVSTATTIAGMHPIMSIDAETSQVTSAINSALAGPHTITVTANVVGMPALHLYTGTMLSPARADGTAYNVRNYIPVSNGYARGNVGLGKDEEALVNELGTESVIRDGKWFLLPGGMHVESLKKDDVILNHMQTKDLIEHGKALGKGKIVGGARAFAQGSLVYNGMPAHSNLSFDWNSNRNPRTFTPSSSSSSSSTSDAIEEAAEKLSEASEEASDAAEEAGSALDGLKEWLGKLFDWIEVKLDRTSKQLDKLEQEAEKAMDNKNYDKAILKYNEAITKSTKAITDNTQAAQRYRSIADEVMNRAVSSGVIDSATAQEIRVKVETGSMDIEEYSDEVREVISSFQTWAEKAKGVEDNITDLQDKLNSYVDSLKEVAEAQRDVAVSQADMYSDIGGGTYAYTGKAKYGQLKASDEGIRRTNDAYAKNSKAMYDALSTVRGGAISSINANKDTNSDYNAALAEARNNMNNGRKIDARVIDEVNKRNPSMAAQLQAYNRAWDNYETANLEYITKVAENSALKQQNTADKFDAADDELEREISNIENENENGNLTASQKNHNIDRIAQRQKKQVQNAQARTQSFQREETTYRTQIQTTKSAKGVNYSGLLPKAKSNVNNTCKEALDAANSGERISDSTLTKLAQFAGSGLITAAFFESCVNYNNALEHRIEAEEAQKIAENTRKQQAGENALKKIENISQESERQRKDITIANNPKRRQLAARKARGEDVEMEEAELELDEQRQIYKNRKDEERRIMKEMEGMDQNSDAYREASDRLEEVRDGALEAGQKIAELGKQMSDLKLTAFDKAIEKLDQLKSRIQSVLDLNEAKGNYTDKTKLGQIAQAARDQAEQSRQKARKYESNANLAKKNGGTWAGHTQDYWEEQANSARIDQNKYQTEAYNTDKAIRELPFEKWNDFTDIIDSTITGLDNKAEMAELKGTLVDVSVLEEKRAQLLEKQNTQNKKIAELQKLVNDPSIGEKARNEYKKQLQEEKNALDATNQSLIQTNQSITNLDIDKLNKAIEVFNLISDNALQTINTIKAEGHYATEEDYKEAVEAQSSAVDYSKDARDEAYNNWQAAKADPNHEYGGFSEQDLFKTFLQADTEWKQARATLAETTKSMAEVWREQFSADSNLAHQETENWEEHLRTKEADGQYITADDITKTIGLVYDELNMKLVEHAKLQELLEEAQQDGREADADAYQQLLGENEQGTEQLEQKIYNLRDQVTEKEIEACDEIINYWQSWIDQFKSTLDPDESKWTTEQKKLIEDASTKIADAKEKKGDIYKEASETAKKEGRGKAANDYAQKSMAAFTQANQTRRSISDLWESKDTSSSNEEEDTLADKLQRELNLLDSEYNILKSKQELLQAQGEDIDPEGYQKRIDALLAKIKKNEELVKANMQLANSSKGDDKKAKEYLQNAKQAEAEVYNLQVEMQNLGDEMRKTWITKDLDEFLDKLGVLMNSLETISGFISNDMMYSMGQITDYGLTSMAMLIKSYEVNNKELGALLEKRAAYIEEYNDGQNPYYSKKEFIEDYKSITAEIQKTAGNAYSLMNRIVDATIKMHEEEVKQIQSVIDKRKELLQQQKDYYAWDRTLKQKTNDISMLEKQRAALQGLTDSESRARLQKINKQLADAREDLENTVTDHNIELQVNGLDALKESLSKSLEDFSKQAKSDVENLMATVDDASELVNGSIERVEANITKMLDALGAEGLDKVSIGYRPYLIPDYTGAQTYVLSDGTILDSDISGKISGGSAGLAGGISSQASSANVKYIVPDMNAQMAPIPRTSDHEVNIQSIINNYTINDASNPDEVWQTIRSKTRELANAISEEIMHNVSYSGIKKNWN